MLWPDQEWEDPRSSTQADHGLYKCPLNNEHKNNCWYFKSKAMSIGRIHNSQSDVFLSEHVKWSHLHNSMFAFLLDYYTQNQKQRWMNKIEFGNVISKLDLCEGGSFSPAIFNSDIQLSVFLISCFIYVCPFVAVLKATYAENLHIVLSSRY